jgi:hypothetical protein
LNDLDLQAIEATIAAIEAQTGLTREQLLASQDDIGRQYRFLVAQARRAQEVALEGVANAAIERGIFRSGIAAQGFADTNQQFTEQIAQLNAAQAQETAGIDAQLAALPQQAAAQAAQARAANANTVLDVDLLRALVNSRV